MHYENVCDYNTSELYLFERSAEKAHRGENGKPFSVTRAWERIESLVIRMYPPVPGKDYYFVNIKVFRPLAPKETGLQSFYRSMRRAGLMQPERSRETIDRYWNAYLTELRLALGLPLPPKKAVTKSSNNVPTTALCEAAPSGPSPVPSAPAPIYFAPLEPLAFDSVLKQAAPLTAAEFDAADLFEASPELLCPASADEATPTYSSPSSEAPEEAPLAAAPATPSSGVRDDWSDSLSEVLHAASSEELDDFCRDLANVIPGEAFI